MPLEHAEFGSFSTDGKKIAFTDKTRQHRTWKRYRGGTAPNIWLFDLETNDAEMIISSSANDEMPMYHENKIYFLSDRGPASRFNIWVYDISSKSVNQVTNFTDYDVHYPGIGPSDMVFEAGGKLYLLNLASGEYNEVNVQVVTDQFNLVPRSETVSNLIRNGAISPKGNRAIIEARGELFSLPAKDGYVKNLTNTSGIAERFPAWSPNGKYVAYFSDRSGEYELTLMDIENSTETKVTNMGPGFRYHLYWSPDNNKLAFIDQAMKIMVFDRTTNQLKEVDQGKYMFQGSLNAFNVSWSSDSRWLAYTRGNENRNSSVFLYDNNNSTRHQVTSDFYSDWAVAFDPDGKYLYVQTNRHYVPEYSDFDNSFIYPNSTNLGAIALRKDVPSPLAPKNDEVSIEEKKSEEPDKKKGKNKDKDENG
jgi:tricorn protease